jgi:hypothetical protein
MLWESDVPSILYDEGLLTREDPEKVLTKNGQIVYINLGIITFGVLYFFFYTKLKGTNKKSIRVKNDPANKPKPADDEQATIN